VARGQGASAQKASAGWALFLEVLTSFRRMRRADRGTGQSPLLGENTLIGGVERLARPVHEIKNASWFLRRRSLPPGLAPDQRPPSGCPELHGFLSLRLCPGAMAQDFLSWKVYGDRRARVKKKWCSRHPCTFLPGRNLLLFIQTRHPADIWFQISPEIQENPREWFLYTTPPPDWQDWRAHPSWTYLRRYKRGL